MSSETQTERYYSYLHNRYFTDAEVEQGRIHWSKWRPSSYGAGKRHWFVSRGGAFGIPREDYKSSRGNLIWFSGPDGAQKAADRLNEKEAPK